MASADAKQTTVQLTDELCSSLKKLYLQTDLGKLDCLGDAIGVSDYDAAVQRSVEFEMSFGRIRVLDLDTLIAAKEATGRDKDKYAVRLLRVLAEKKSAVQTKQLVNLKS